MGTIKSYTIGDIEKAVASVYADPCNDLKTRPCHQCSLYRAMDIIDSGMVDWLITKLKAARENKDQGSASLPDNKNL
jgi:hypothetical protein